MDKYYYSNKIMMNKNVFKNKTKQTAMFSFSILIHRTTKMSKKRLFFFFFYLIFVSTCLPRWLVGKMIHRIKYNERIKKEKKVFSFKVNL